MNGQSEENLKELFERFVDSEQAEEAVEEIRKAEQILRAYPAPQPDSELIVDIKAEVTDALLHRKANAFRRAVYKVAVVAAAVIVLAIINVKLFQKGNGIPERPVRAAIIPVSIWESEDIRVDDANLATLIAETKQIEGELRALQLGENGANGDKELVELEMRLIEVSGDFWKG
ncbi:MAG: hypothetical protein ACYS0I_03900 [Planctomycetota bacterium]|jgi:hypothetical protein